MLASLGLAALIVLAWWLVDVDAPAPADLEDTDPRRPQKWTAPPGPGPAGAVAKDEVESDEDAAAEPPKPSVPFVVTVLDSHGRPLAGVRIHDHDARSHFVTTGEDGRAVLDFGAGEERLRVRISGTAPASTRTLEERVTVLNLPDVVDLEVVLIDGETGCRLTGGQVTLRTSDGPDLPLSREDDHHVLAQAPLARGYGGGFRLGVEPPSGYAIERREDLRVKGRFSRFATRVVVPIVLRREAVISVLVTRTKHGPVAGVRVSRVTLGPYGHAYRAEPTDSSGRTVVRGMPLVRGETARVTVRWGVCDYSGTVEMDRQPLLGTTIVLPEKPPTMVTASSSIGIGGGAGGTFGGRGSRRILKNDDATIEVIVRRRDGSPAVGARVRLWPLGARRPRPLDARTDARGVVVFRQGAPGRARISVLEVGFIHGGMEIDLRPGTRQQVEIVESEGQPVTVEVVDEQGVPVPCAQITIGPSKGIAFAWMEADVQILRQHTDARGRLVVPRLAPGTVTLTARFGSRKASGKVEAGGGLVLRLGR